MRTSIKLAIFFGFVLYMMLTFFAFIYSGFNHARAWAHSTTQITPLVYYAAWACHMSSNKRRTNLYLGLGYLLLWGSLIALWCYCDNGTFRFGSKEIQMYNTHTRTTIIGITYGWFATWVIILSLILAFIHVVLFFLLDPKDNQLDKTSFTDQLRQIEHNHKPQDITSSIMGAHMLDKALNGHKKHDHSLGSYWSDHDDDGNYDPGAWRRKYDHQ